MKRYEKKVVEKEVLIEVVCDICGESCIENDGQNFEFSSLLADWGYGSYRDGEKWDYSFCMACSDELLDSIEERKEENDKRNKR